MLSNAFETSPLFGASENGHAEIVKIHIDHKADVNQKMKNTGLTPLMIAASHGHYEVIEMLREAGADKALENHSQLPSEWTYASIDGIKSRAHLEKNLFRERERERERER